MVWAIALTDFLLVLQVIKPHSQMFTYEWFSENKFIAQPVSGSCLLELRFCFK